MNKGTLTILSDTHFIMTADDSLTSVQRNQLTESVSQWAKSGGILMLPISLEVIDMRTPQKSNENEFPTDLNTCEE